MTWNGRKLMSYNKSGQSISYKYDGNGLRTQKVINGVNHYYYYENNQLLYEIREGVYELYYKYDADGKLFSVTRYRYSDGEKHVAYAVTNTRGDVIELRSSTGAIYAKYVYDSWGKCISVTDSSGSASGSASVAVQNSIRYRGYVYDHETGLYYLQSRYYDPETGRFLNADDVKYIGYSGENISYNAFAYCENNSIINFDRSGYQNKNKSKIDKALNIISKYSTIILKYAFYYGVDPLAVAGAIFAEQAFRYNLRDILTDRILAKFFDTSIGLGQIKLSKAKMLEENKVICPQIVNRGKNMWYVPGYGFYRGGYSDAIIKRLYIEEENINYVSAFIYSLQQLWITSYPEIVNDLVMLVSLYNYSEATPNGVRYVNAFGLDFELYMDDIERHLYGSASIAFGKQLIALIRKVLKSFYA